LRVKLIPAALIVVLLAGALLRYGYLKEYSRSPEFANPAVDAGYHDYWARGLAFGSWKLRDGFSDPLIQRKPYFRPPGYAYFLAGVYLLSGGSFAAPRVAAALCGLAVALAGYFLAKRWFSPSVGLGWAAVLSLYWVFIFYEGELLGVWTAVALVVCLLACLARWRYRTGLYPGLLVGLFAGVFALFRTNILLLAPAAVLWLGWLKFRANQRRFFPTILGLAAGIIIVVLPVFLRNCLVAGEPVPIAANTGMSLAIGLNQETDGTNHYLPGYGQFASPFDYPEAVRKLAISRGMDLNYVQASTLYSRMALRYALEEPVSFINLLIRKTGLFWGPGEVANNRDLEAIRKVSPALSQLPGSFSLLLSLALAGILAWRLRPPGDPDSSRRSELVVLLIGFIIVYFISVLPAAAASRYRVPIIPVLGLLASIGLVEEIKLLTGRRYFRSAIVFAVWVVMFFLCSLNPTGYVSSGAKMYYDRGIAFEAAGNEVLAEAEYRRTLELDPAYTQASSNLGALLLGRGEISEAIRLHRNALRMDSSSAREWSNLGQVLLADGRLEEASNACRRALELDEWAVKARNNLGIIYQRQGLMDKAGSSFRRALRDEPGYPEAAYNLANLLYNDGKKVEAEKLYRLAIESRPEYAAAWNNLGNLLVDQGRHRQAVSAYRRALEGKDPPVSAWGNLGNLLAAAGDYTSAEGCYRRALKKQPGNPDILVNFAYCLELSGRGSEALSYYRKVLVLEPGRKEARLGEGRVISKQEKDDIGHGENKN